jgi:hypothetical protein
VSKPQQLSWPFVARTTNSASMIPTSTADDPDTQLPATGGDCFQRGEAAFPTLRVPKKALNISATKSAATTRFGSLGDGVPE